MADRDLMFDALLAEARDCTGRDLCETKMVFNPVKGRRPERYLVRKFVVDQLEFLRDAEFTSSKELNGHVAQMLSQPLDTRERMHVAAYKVVFLDDEVKANAVRVFSNSKGTSWPVVLVGVLVALVVALLLKKMLA